MGIEEWDGGTIADTAVAASSQTEVPAENQRSLLADAGYPERERAVWLLAVQGKQWSILGATLDGHGSAVLQRVQTVEPAVVVAATVAPLLES